jgi:hypothetical protein
MKKNILWMLAAILICGLTVTTMSACSSDDDNKTEGKTEVTMMYVVKVSDDVLKVADVEVNYIDQTGAKKKEKLSTTEWKKTFSTNTLPVTEGVWAKMTPKTNIGTGSYSLQVTTAAGYQAKLASGKTISDGYGSNPEAKPTTAQTAEEIADWCSQSPTIGIAIDQTGYSKQQHVDFGGNVDAVIDRFDICYWIFSFFGFDANQCYD